MHLNAPEEVLAAFWDLALQADALMPAWGIARRLPSPTPGRPPARVSLRCLEALDYFPGNGTDNSTDSNTYACTECKADSFADGGADGCAHSWAYCQADGCTFSFANDHTDRGTNG